MKNEYDPEKDTYSPENYVPEHRLYKRRQEMNYSTAVMLINENIKAIRVSYEPDKHGSYIFKTIDTTLKPEDFVVVPTNTRHGMTVCKVEEVNVAIDFDSETEIKWVISKVDNESYQNILAEEAKMIETLKASEKRKKREDLRKNLVDMYQDANFEAMAIAHLGEPESATQE